ncbi:hypothetical protein Syun_017272 [Stephania yunnanensis]|uniref:Uncharacterized protein n=1 Tax=Stephania yunnanensis TaxID=152371 RepID=A0AAP0J877_9MAGN
MVSPRHVVLIVMPFIQCSCRNGVPTIFPHVYVACVKSHPIFMMMSTQFDAVQLGVVGTISKLPYLTHLPHRELQLNITFYHSNLSSAFKQESNLLREGKLARIIEGINNKINSNDVI